MSNIMKPPPQYGAPPVQPRRSYRWVWITLGTLVLVGLVGGALVWIFAVSPTIASDQYYTAIRDQNYAKAYADLGSDLQARLSQEAFIQRAQQQDEALGRVSKYSYVSLPLGDPATETLTVTRADGTTYTAHLELRHARSVMTANRKSAWIATLIPL
jgi:hypothetical protein